MYRGEVTGCEEIRIPEQSKCEALESGIRNPGRGICPWNPLYGIQNSQISIESRIHFCGTREFGIRSQDPRSPIWDPEFMAWNLESESHLGFPYIGRERGTSRRTNTMPFN